MSRQPPFASCWRLPRRFLLSSHIRAMALLLREEKDEYLRSRTIDQSLIATGILLTVATLYGFLFTRSMSPCGSTLGLPSRCGRSGLNGRLFPGIARRTAWKKSKRDEALFQFARTSPTGSASLRLCAAATEAACAGLLRSPFASGNAPLFGLANEEIFPPAPGVTDLREKRCSLASTRHDSSAFAHALAQVPSATVPAAKAEIRMDHISIVSLGSGSPVVFIPVPARGGVSGRDRARIGQASQRLPGPGQLICG